ncbi:MAG: RluA family pseudouridine synthase [Alphaproteobacteria bacterium]
MSDKLKTQIVSDEDGGLRLDRWFRRYFAHVTHGQLQKLLRTGQVRVEGKRCEASQRLEAGQTIRVPPQIMAPPKTAVKKKSQREENDLKKLILYEDDDVIAFNKPSGLASQGGSGLKTNLDDMLAALPHKKHGKPRLVHRLDRDTSGVLLVARTPSAAARLSEAFRERATQKIYWALTVGIPKPEQGRIDAPLIKNGEIMTVDEKDHEDAKSAVTVYQTVESAKKLAAFVAMWPITGRTHQLRVHMSYIGTPLFGDRLYGGEKSLGVPAEELGKGLHLHARRLIIPHPRRGTIDIIAPLGPNMRKTWTWFGFDPNEDVDFSKA